MKVAVLTMFCGLSSTYSLVNVVADQIEMLLRANIQVKVLVSETCPDQERKGIFADKRIEWVKIINTYKGANITWHDYSSGTGKVHETFFEEAELIAADFVRHLKDVDVCILHDILYQGWHLIHNIAIRTAQKELPHLRFLAFTHSLPLNRPMELEYPFSARYTPMPRTTFVYPTYSGLGALARQYDVPLGRCAVVYNTLPLLESMGEDVRRAAENIDLMKAEILIVYPARLTTGKRFEKVAALAGAIKSKGEKNTKVIFCDFPSADIPVSVYKGMVRMEGKRYGLGDEDMLFTSDIGYPQGFPRQGIFELFTLSNLFICPSYSESFGLTVLEAGSRGNFLVLNEAVPALKELGEALGAYLMRWDARNFGYDTHEKYLPSERAYYEDHGANIVNLMREDQGINAKTIIRSRYHSQWIFENQLMPLLEMGR
ncbi:glycosyltransferase [Angelakisella massiliensis]|uniref:glycosyltransferase n=1 Tax=Angelakisella massiliensis TaxID=1871018 RepID=UPI0023A822E7|nr:glycosyltransferase [Angelakisella massiliensis]